jgi:hypothetical protein
LYATFIQQLVAKVAKFVKIATITSAKKSISDEEML